MDSSLTDLEQGKNTGVIVDFKPTDFHAGGETAITYEARLATADWTPFKPTDEWQRYFLNGILGYETECCVTFSGIRIICMQLEFMKEHGLIPADTLAQCEQLGYFDANGKFNFSEWFSANTNGTTEAAGNSFQGFWDGVNRDGLLPQGDGPGVNDFTRDTGGFLDASKITDAQRAKAKRFRDLFWVPYEWVVMQSGSQAVFEYHLKQAPIHILIPTCSGFNTAPPSEIQDCHVQSVNHCQSLLAILPDNGYKELDHYVPFIKYLAPNYYVPYGVKGVVMLKSAEPVPGSFHYVFNVQLTYGDSASNEVKMLQTALQTLKGKNGLPYMKAGVFGPFGPATKLALGNFQSDHGIKDPGGQGMDFGPATRSAMNSALLKPQS